MALVDCGPIYYPDVDSWSAGLGTTLAMTGAGFKAAFLITVPKTGSITAVTIRTGTVTSSQTLRVTLQTCDATTGDASGTLYGGSAAGTQAAPASNTMYSVTLGTPASATYGDQVWVVVEFDSTAGNLIISSMTMLTNHGYPATSLYNGTTWTRGAGWFAGYLDYGGTAYYDQTLPVATVTITTINSGSAPNEYATNFTLPFPCRVRGFMVLGTPNSNTATVDFILYDASNNVLASRSFDPKRMFGSSAARPTTDIFNAPAIIAANTLYRLAMKPTSVNAMNITYWDFPSAAALGALSGGTAVSSSSRTGAGAWTNNAARRIALVPMIDQVDDGSGGGSAGSPIIVRRGGTIMKM
jgi:hypothetical protein